ncbi:MAG TPA: hypothetical protein VMU89_14905 [Thermomicrobiaceae bacterium]|nr:hypothetical protein [Thermomicrobiaceae bacterium]
MSQLPPVSVPPAGVSLGQLALASTIGAVVGGVIVAEMLKSAARAWTRESRRR